MIMILIIFCGEGLIGMSIKGLFQKAAIGLLMLAPTVVFAEPVLMTLAHANSGGMEYIDKLSPWLNALFDSTGITDLFHWVADIIPTYDSGLDTVDELSNSGVSYGNNDLTTNQIPPNDAIEQALDELDF